MEIGLVPRTLQNEWKGPKTQKSLRIPKIQRIPLVPGIRGVGWLRGSFLAFAVFGVAVGESGAKHLLADAAFCEETLLLRFKKFVEEI